MQENAPENILDNIENLLENISDSKLQLASEERIPTSEEISLKNDQSIKENPAAYKESLKELLKHSLMMNSPKNEHLPNLKKKVIEILKLIDDEKSLSFYFDEFFFDKFELLTERKEVCQFIEIVEICLSLVSNEKILLGICLLRETRRIFTMLLNYLLEVTEQLNFNLLGLSVQAALKFLLEFLKKNNYMKKENEKLVEIYEKNCQSFKINDEDSFNLEKFLNTLDKSDRKKYDILNYLNYMMSNCENYNQQMEILTGVMDQVFAQLIKIHSNYNAEADSKKIFLLDDITTIYDKILFQYEYYITLDQNYVHETKIYGLNYEKAILQKYPKIYYNLARILNEVLLIPFEFKLQKKALNLVRRFYNLFPKLREHLIKPINVLFSNISLFAETTVDTKDAAIFLYQLLHDPENKEFADILNNNEHLRFIKESKYFSIKAMSYPQEIDNIYNIRTLHLNCFYPNKKVIEAERYFSINLHMKNDYSLIYWKFATLNYDIGFGLYKFNIFEDVPMSKIEEYVKNGKIECVVPNSRVFSNNSYITGAILVMGNGLYRLIFDNTYSFWRAKTLFYSVHMLEKKRIVTKKI